MAFFRGFFLYFLLYSPCFFPRDVGSCSNAGCKCAFPLQAVGMGLAELLPFSSLSQAMNTDCCSQSAGWSVPSCTFTPLPVWTKGCPPPVPGCEGPCVPEVPCAGWAECLHCDTGVRSAPLHPATAAWAVAENVGLYCCWQYIHQCCKSLSGVWEPRGNTVVLAQSGAQELIPKLGVK